MINFCTVFDLNYISRGLTMYQSLMKHCPNFQLHIICLDQTLYNYLNKEKFKNIIAISLIELENKYPELEVAKKNRTYVEYIFTLSPYIALYLLDLNKDIQAVTTLDADLYFFDDPSDAILNNSQSIAITPHNFKKGYSKHIKYGKYNVCFQTFNNDTIGLACLNKWKEQCFEWCYDSYEDGKFADQKYLDTWLVEYGSVYEYRNGTESAPWNIYEKDLAISENGEILIKNTKLICYHFHGVRNISPNIFSLGLVDYRVIKRNKIVNLIYKEYIQQLTKNNFYNSKIVRRMHPKLGRIVYLVFLADLYRYKNNSLKRIYNLSFLRMLFSYVNSIF